VPQYPEELHPILSHLALIDALKAMQATEAVQLAVAELEEMERNLNSLISNRDEGSPRKIVSRRGIWDTGGV
jgi:DNA-binding GntR family transcriptional regulator